MQQLTAAKTPLSSNKLFALDFLRALAITLVFLYHYGRLFPHPEWTKSISQFGIVATVFAAFIMNKLIEKPFLQLRDNLLCRNKGKAKS